MGNELHSRLAHETHKRFIHDLAVLLSRGIHYSESVVFLQELFELLISLLALDPAVMKTFQQDEVILRLAANLLPLPAEKLTETFITSLVSLVIEFSVFHQQSHRVFLLDTTHRIFADFAQHLLFLPAFWAKLSPHMASSLHSAVIDLFRAVDTSQYLACLAAINPSVSDCISSHRSEVHSVLRACASRESPWTFHDSIYDAMREMVLEGVSLSELE